MQETGRFPIGVRNEAGELCTDFTLEERTFRHTLELANDKGIDRELLSNAVYYDAAVLSKRLQISGVKRVTPEMVLNLDGEDGDLLADAIMKLDARRGEFRAAKPPAQAEADSAGKTGDPVA